MYMYIVMDTDDKLEGPVEHSRHLAIMRTRLLLFFVQCKWELTYYATFGTRWATQHRAITITLLQLQHMLSHFSFIVSWLLPYINSLHYRTWPCVLIVIHTLHMRILVYSWSEQEGMVPTGKTSVVNTYGILSDMHTYWYGWLRPIDCKPRKGNLTSCASKASFSFYSSVVS